MATPKVFLQYGFFVFLLCNLLSCNSTPTKELSWRTQRVVSQAQQVGLTEHRYKTSTFLLTTYERIPEENPKRIHVYIEGDGNSWKSKYKLSNNPTPKQPLALSLALRDPHPNVIYIARPCQYTPLALDEHCHNKYWSSHRYAPEVITAMNDVLDQLSQDKGQPTYEVIGFSGGATLAVFIAAQRKDVRSLRTVAGDLNHTALNQYHHTSPLVGSLNPTTVAKQLSHLPQRHFSGEKDVVVPPWVAAEFAQQVGSQCAQTYVLKGAGHHKGWEENWPALLQEPLPCMKKSS